MTKLVALIAVIFCVPVHAGKSFGVGQRDYVFQDTARSRKLATHVWYPIDATVKVSPAADKRDPFIPVSATKDASLPESSQKFPVVLLSHGSGGKANKLFWLTEYLVKNGIIVIGTDHQGNMTGDNSGDGMMRVWNRPKDLSFALDQISAVPEFKERLDLSKVAAAGHSAGGTTVLQLAGARLSSARLTSPVPNCEGTKDPYLALWCEQIKKIDMKSYPKEVVEGDYSDSRVKAVVSLDPGFAQSFQPDTLQHLKSKTLVLLAEKLNSPKDEIHSKEFLKLMPAGTAEVIPSSFHFTFLQACKPNFPKDDPELKELCIENDRKLKIQGTVSERTLQFFQKEWSQK